MRRESALGGDTAILRSLKIAKTTFSVVLASTALVATNVMVTLRVLSFPAQVAILVVTFMCVCIIITAVVADVFSRSNQILGTLRTLGAKRETILVTTLVSLLGFGAIGSVLGAVVGVGLGAVIDVPGTATQGALTTLIDGLLVCGSLIAATEVGAFFGVRTSWRN